MDKQTFISRAAAAHKVFKGIKMSVASGGAMLLRDLREQTGDVDLSISDNLVYNQFLASGAKVHKFENRGRVVYVASREDLPDVDVHLVGKDELIGEVFKLESDGYKFELLVPTVEQILQFKLMLNRDKDQNDIKILKAEIQKKQSKH